MSPIRRKQNKSTQRLQLFGIGPKDMKRTECNKKKELQHEGFFITEHHKICTFLLHTQVM